VQVLHGVTVKRPYQRLCSEVLFPLEGYSTVDAYLKMAGPKHDSDRFYEYPPKVVELKNLTLERVKAAKPETHTEIKLVPWRGIALAIQLTDRTFLTEDA
jgi:hypothetical protein